MTKNITPININAKNVIVFDFADNIFGYPTVCENNDDEVDDDDDDEDNVEIYKS